MKIAIVHDYIKEYGGAERVLEALHDIYPDADIYTSVFLPKFLGPHRDRFENWNIKTSFLQYLPFKSKLISPFRIISPLIFRLFDFSNYDLIITSSTGAYMPNGIRKGKAKLICYCHTPPRYLYGYETARKVNNPILKFGSLILFHFLRLFDFYAAQNVDQFIANSEEVKKRIWKLYRRESVVINPPISQHAKYNIQNTKKRSFYLAGGRLARAKHPELAIKAAKKLGFKLKVFGRSFAGYGEYLEKLSKNHKNIEILGEVSEDKKWELLSDALVYISPSKDEDFGILNVESLAAGTPVIAHASGGALETIIDGETGVLFSELTEEGIVKAIKKFEKLKIKSSDCRKQAEKFSESRFKTDLRRLVTDIHR